MVTSIPSFSGLWVYKDDHTDVRILGALAKVCPQLVSLESMVDAIQDQGWDDLKVRSAERAYERAGMRPVEPGEGSSDVPFTFDLPGWTTMEEGLVIRGIEQGGGFRGGEEGYQPVRNSVFKKYSTRSMRPIVNFETCIKCTLCWLQCPDTCFDVTPDGLYDANLESCCGCGVCEAVCPVADCVTMINEAEFNDNDSQYEAWQEDKAGYQQWMITLIEKQKQVDRTHGFHHVGGYAEQIAEAGED